MRSSVQCLDIFRIHGNGSACIFDNFIPFILRVITGSSIGVIDWIRFAKDGLAIEIDGFGVVFRTVCFVSLHFELCGVVVSVLLVVSHVTRVEIDCSHLAKKSLPLIQKSLVAHPQFQQLQLLLVLSMIRWLCSHQLLSVSGQSSLTGFFVFQSDTTSGF